MTSVLPCAPAPPSIPSEPIEIGCDECGVCYTQGEDHECLTCDCCGDEMHVATNCLGQADCCMKYDNICTDCGHYDDSRGIVVCSECDPEVVYSDADDDDDKTTITDASTEQQ